MSIRTIPTARKRLDARLQAPASKSVTHRALITAALAEGRSHVSGPLEADDTRITREGLARLGVELRAEGDGWTVEGRGGRIAGGATLALGESGTSMRFLTAVAALGQRPSTLDGAPRLRERPMRELAEALGALGGRVELSPDTAGLPLRAGGSGFEGGRARVPGARSSQFASALMLIGPYLRRGLRLELGPPAVSLPYVELTERVMRAFGADVRRVSRLEWDVRPVAARGTEFAVEGDHSSASYFLAAAAVVGGEVTLVGLDPASAQADARFTDVLESLGCDVRRGEDEIAVRSTKGVPAFDLAMDDAPDVVPTLAVLGLFADGPCTIRGVSHLRLKESDRLELLAANLRRLGRDARASDDRLEIGPASDGLRAATIQTDSDHRMAMAFAVAGLRIEGVTIDDADCVDKSNPRFWDQFGQLLDA